METAPDPLSVDSPAADSPAADSPAAAAAQPRFIPGFARLFLGVFFREVQVVGTDRVPPTGPTVFVANHINALVDPALLLAYLPRRPRFLAKSTLWKIPLVRTFADLAAAIPVYRRQDAGVDATRNAETFARCHEVLAAGGSIALFPEGRSHSEPAVVPLKTGVSRIVLEAEARFGGLGVRVVPVGLTFEEKARFRSRALVVVGEPMAIDADVAAYRREPWPAVEALTARIRQRLEDVTVNYTSWEEARLLGRAAEIFARPASELPDELDQDRRFAVRRAVAEGYAELAGRHPREVAELAAAVAEYDDQLAIHGLSDRQVAARYPVPGVVAYVARSALLLGLRLPLAVLGTALNAVPWYVVRVLVRLFGRSPDVVATYKLLGSFVLYPLTWIAEAAVAGRFLGPMAGLAVLVVAPASAWLALRFHERRWHFLAEARAYLWLRTRRAKSRALRALRDDLSRRLRALAADLDVAGVAPPAPAAPQAGSRATGSPQVSALQ